MKNASKDTTDGGVRIRLYALEQEGRMAYIICSVAPVSESGRAIQKQLQILRIEIRN